MKRMAIADLWAYLDEEYQAVVKSSDGEWYPSQDKPRKLGYGWIGISIHPLHLSLDYDGPWEESLHERPRAKVMYSIEDSVEIHVYDKACCSHPTFPCKEAPPDVAAWYRSVMEARG